MSSVPYINRFRLSMRSGCSYGICGVRHVVMLAGQALVPARYTQFAPDSLQPNVLRDRPITLPCLNTFCNLPMLAALHAVHWFAASSASTGNRLRFENHTDGSGIPLK